MVNFVDCHGSDIVLRVDPEHRGSHSGVTENEVVGRKKFGVWLKLKMEKLEDVRNLETSNEVPAFRWWGQRPGVIQPCQACLQG